MNHLKIKIFIPAILVGIALLSVGCTKTTVTIIDCSIDEAEECSSGNYLDFSNKKGRRYDSGIAKFPNIALFMKRHNRWFNNHENLKDKRDAFREERRGFQKEFFRKGFDIECLEKGRGESHERADREELRRLLQKCRSN